MIKIVWARDKIMGYILKFFHISLLSLAISLAISASGNINLPDDQDASRQMSNNAITITQNSIICRADDGGKYVPLALLAGQEISPEWPELIVASLIISEAMKPGGEKAVITFNNAMLTIAKNLPNDSLYCFIIEKIGKKVEAVPNTGVMLPINGTAEELKNIGAKIIDLSPDRGFIVYFEMPASQVEPFVKKTDQILKILFPNWQVGARQSIASIAANSDKKNVRIPYNGTWINIYSNSFSFSGGICKFMIGIIPIKN